MRTLDDIRSNLDYVGCDNRTVLELCDEVERLREKLPKTKDGVNVGCGDVIYVILEHDGTIEEDTVGSTAADCYNEYDVSECYSTHEAAEKARTP